MFIYDIKEQINSLPEPYRTQFSEAPDEILFQVFSKEIQGILDCVKVSIFIVDAEKRIVAINREARERLSADPDLIIGKPLSELISRNLPGR